MKGGLLGRCQQLRRERVGERRGFLIHSPQFGLVGIAKIRSRVYELIVSELDQSARLRIEAAGIALFVDGCNAGEQLWIQVDCIVMCRTGRVPRRTVRASTGWSGWKDNKWPNFGQKLEKRAKSFAVRKAHFGQSDKTSPAIRYAIPHCGLLGDSLQTASGIAMLVKARTHVIGHAEEKIGQRRGFEFVIVARLEFPAAGTGEEDW